jgi:hypothetical protein
MVLGVDSSQQNFSGRYGFFTFGLPWFIDLGVKRHLNAREDQANKTAHPSAGNVFV